MPKTRTPRGLSDGHRTALDGQADLTPNCRLALAPRQDAGGALRALAVALAPFLRELVEAEQYGDERVEVASAVPGPRRVVLRACRTGKITDAVKVGRKWIASRGAINSWLQSLGPRRVVAQSRGDDLEALRASLARAGGSRR